MSRKLLFCLFICFISIASYSQTQTLKGTLKDSSENRVLSNTVISVLTIKDSILVKYGRADKAGNFKIEGLKPGKYILMVT